MGWTEIDGKMDGKMNRGMSREREETIGRGKKGWGERMGGKERRE